MKNEEHKGLYEWRNLMIWKMYDNLYEMAMNAWLKVCMYTHVWKIVEMKKKMNVYDEVKIAILQNNFPGIFKCIKSAQKIWNKF